MNRALHFTLPWLTLAAAACALASSCGSDDESTNGAGNAAPAGGGGSTQSGGSTQGGSTQGGSAQGGSAQGGSMQGGGGGHGGSTGSGGSGASPPVELCPEPLPATWIFCDDFEAAGAVGDRYDEYDDNGGDFVPVTDEAHSGGHSMQVVFQQGEVGAGSLHVTFGRNPIGSQYRTDEDFTDVYWRMYLKNQVGWTGSPAKLSRATAFAASDWSQAMIAHLWSSGDVLLGDPAGCVSGSAVQCSGYNDFANLDWLGQMPGTTPIFATGSAGQWRCIEGHARLNDPGASNGVFEFWIDGHLENHRADLDWRGSWQEYGLNAVFFENYWNSGSPVEQRRYFDDLAIATERIGCF